MVLLYAQLGPAALVGALMLVLLFPVQVHFSLWTCSPEISYVACLCIYAVCFSDSSIVTGELAAAFAREKMSIIYTFLCRIWSWCTSCNYAVVNLLFICWCCTPLMFVLLPCMLFLWRKKIIISFIMLIWWYFYGKTIVMVSVRVLSNLLQLPKINNLKLWLLSNYFTLYIDELILELNVYDGSIPSTPYIFPN